MQRKAKGKQLSLEKKLEHILPEFESLNITDYKLNTEMFESLNIKNNKLNTVIETTQKTWEGGWEKYTFSWTKSNKWSKTKEWTGGIGDVYIVKIKLTHDDSEKT